MSGAARLIPPRHPAGTPCRVGCLVFCVPLAGPWSPTVGSNHRHVAVKMLNMYNQQLWSKALPIVGCTDGAAGLQS